jgi:prepilin-type N-terminal cleavage/methylation domain-containing protein
MTMRRPGFTLIELLVTIALLGVITSVATLAFRKIEAPPPNDPISIVCDSLRSSVAHDRRSTLRFVVHGASAAVSVFPDGSILADSALSIDRLSGRFSK